MQKKLLSRKIILVFLICIVFTVAGMGWISENFRSFLTSNGELISTLAHPTNEFVRSYMNSDDYLVIISKSSFTGSIQKLKIYIPESFDEFEVISDDSFVPAFMAIGFVKDILVDFIKDEEFDSDSSEGVNRLANAIFEKIDDMDGRQLSYCILLLRWVTFND